MASILPIARRALFAALVFGVALLAGVRAAGTAQSKDNPEAALRLNSNDPVALVYNLDRQLVQSGGTGVTAPALTDAGRRALRISPLNAGALRLVALGADISKDHDRASTLMQLSTRVSRRDLGTHVWTIEDRVNAGDIAGALDHYDLALSTDSRASAILYPVLSGALDDPQIRAKFSPLIGQRRPWMMDFLTYAIANVDNPQGLAEMVMARGGLPADPAYRALETLLLKQLAVKGQYAMAYRYALSLPGARAAALNDPGFNDQSMNPELAPLTWQLFDQSTTHAARDENRIAVTASPATRGAAATRIIFLKPGSYQLIQTVEPMEGRDPASLSWELHCLPQSSSFNWQQDVPPSSAPASYRAAINIPAGCRVQQLTLFAVGADSQSESGARVGGVRIEPK